MKLRTQYEVIVVGAGPAGLVAAIGLARAGVRTLVVERRRHASTLPRATGVSTRTMEILRSWGLEREVRAAGLDLVIKLWETDTLASREGVERDVGYPTREEAATLSPTAPSWTPQDQLEPVLRAELARLPAAELRGGVELTGFEQDSDGVRARLREPATAAETEVEARFLIGADGPRSAVRERLAIAFEGSPSLAETDGVLFRAPLAPVVGDRRYGLYTILCPGAEGFFLPMGRDDRWVFGRRVDPALASLSDLRPAAMRSLLACAAGAPGLEVSIERVNRVTYGAQIAERFRRGRAFLVGDAAHRVSPRGGTGMNMAIHGAYDLSWRLAWVLRGWAEPRLFEGYEAERRPVALHNIERGKDPNGSLRGLEDALPVDLGERIPHAWLDAGRGVSTLDLVGAGLTLLHGPEAHAGAGWRAGLAGAGPRAPISAAGLDEPTAARLGLGPAGALLVRPDGVPLARWEVPLASPARTIARVLEGAGVLTRSHGAALRARPAAVR
jgi:putative polyketide hydroxylase